MMKEFINDFRKVDLLYELCYDIHIDEDLGVFLYECIRKIKDTRMLDCNIITLEKQIDRYEYEITFSGYLGYKILGYDFWIFKYNDYGYDEELYIKMHKAVYGVRALCYNNAIELNKEASGYIYNVY